MTTSIHLEDLVGNHVLRGVDIPKTGEHKLADWIRFTLDNKVYLATEDPNDGYRSTMDRIDEVDTKVENAFRGVKVIATMRQPLHMHTILDIAHAKTSKVILSVGTGQCDDYYPSWVAQFYPENL